MATRRHHRVALLTLLTLAVLVRLGLSLAGWPETDSDEATIGLAALHIARDGAHPAYFYGQDYMGTLEAWLGAAAFRVLGVSTFALRLGVIALSGAGFFVVYRLALALYDRRVALGSLAWLLLGSEPVLYLQVKALGGHAETLLFGALCLLLATRLAIDAGEPHASPWPRRAGFAGWGLSAGLGLWTTCWWRRSWRPPPCRCWPAAAASCAAGRCPGCSAGCCWAAPRCGRTTWPSAPGTAPPWRRRWASARPAASPAEAPPPGTSAWAAPS